MTTVVEHTHGAMCIATSTTPGNIGQMFQSVLKVRENASSQIEISETIANLQFLMNKSMEYEKYELAGGIMEHLGYLLLQENRRDEAVGILEQLNYAYCLGTNIICYDNKQNKIATNQNNNNIVHVYKNVLNDVVLSKLQKAFHQKSKFWDEHNYPCGYFSYSHKIANISSSPSTSNNNNNSSSSNHNSTNLLEQFASYIQQIILEKFPKVKDAKVVEWWAHRRPHCHSHQMHFDSDNEGIGTVRNPIASTVFYLTPEGIGGPTLVTTQTLQSQTLADRGWLIFPKENCLGVFSGKYLHGVIPGKGFCTQKQTGTTLNNNMGEATPSLLPPRRITLMVAFWDDIEIRDNKEPGASRMFPSSNNANSTNYVWPTLLKPIDQEIFDNMHANRVNEEIPMIEVTGPIWEPLIASPTISTTDGNSTNTPTTPQQMPRYDDCFQYPVM
jgi:hypothetical protein